MNWKTISSEYLFKDLWFTIRKDKCIKPDGSMVDPYYVYEFPDWVTAVAITKEKQILLIRQYRHAIGEVVIEIPGGCVDASDKNLEEACARELMEETGYRFEKMEYLCKTSANPSTNSNLMHIFLATGGEKIAEQKLDEAEDIEILLLSIDQVKQLLRSNQLLQSMHVTALLYGLNRIGELHY